MNSVLNRLLLLLSGFHDVKRHEHDKVIKKSNYNDSSIILSFSYESNRLFILVPFVYQSIDKKQVFEFKLGWGTNDGISDIFMLPTFSPVFLLSELEETVRQGIELGLSSYDQWKETTVKRKKDLINHQKLIKKLKNDKIGFIKNEDPIKILSSHPTTPEKNLCLTIELDDISEDLLLLLEREFSK